MLGNGPKMLENENKLNLVKILERKLSRKYPLKMLLKRKKFGSHFDFRYFIHFLKVKINARLFTLSF
jgi:hypothetical protein